MHTILRKVYRRGYFVYPAKSPGPDWFSSGFFKKSWEVVGPLVLNAVQEFFQTGKMLKQCNATSLVLLPKVQNLNNASEFRAISCCNVIYKCISKHISNSLKVVLSELVNPSQGAFMKGRELLFNVLVCQELARGYNRKTISPRCMMKIDLKKAYDSIHWDFIQEVLDTLKFPKLFSQWVMACITTTSFSIQLNRDIVGHFQGGRGLIQGDPISPLLFVLAKEYLSRLFQKQSMTKGFGFHPNCRRLKIVHLMFADDLILFCKADTHNVASLTEAFKIFSRSSGMEANQAKS